MKFSARMPALLLAAAFASAALTPASGQLLWSETFDDLSFLDGMSAEPCGDMIEGCDCGEGTSLRVLSPPFRHGGGALMSRLAKCHERAELREKSANHPAIGDLRYYGFSLRPDVNFDLERWTICAQWAQWWGTVPAWANTGAWNFLKIEGGRWVFKAKWSEGTAENVATSETDLGPVLRNQWTDFIVQARWRAIKGGELKVWVRQPGQTSYTLKVEREGSVMLDVPKAPYFKVGAYRGDPNWRSPRAVDYLFVDEVRVGTSLDAVRIPYGLLDWRAEHFGGVFDNETVGDGSDPDGDGAPNLLEYALGSDPLAATPESLYQAERDAEGRLGLLFVRLRADLIYEVLGSSDLSAWSVIATNPGAVGETASVSHPADAATPARFLRLRVRRW